MSSEFLKRGHTKAAACSFRLLHGGICIHWRKGRMKNSPQLSKARSWWCCRTAWEKGVSNLFHYMSVFKGYFRNPDTQHTYKPANYSMPDLYSNKPACVNTWRVHRGRVRAGQKPASWYSNKSLFTHQGTGSCSWVRIQCIRGHMLPQY